MKLPDSYNLEMKISGINPNEKFYFPWCAAIEGKTIVGIETFATDTTNGITVRRNLRYTPKGNEIVYDVVANRLALTFKDVSQKEILVNMPYLALKRTGTFATASFGLANPQPRQLKPSFGFQFSSKDSYVTSFEPGYAFAGDRWIYIVLKYLR